MSWMPPSKNPVSAQESVQLILDRTTGERYEKMFKWHN